MQLTWIRRGREQIGGDELERLDAAETHLPELIGQRCDVWGCLLLAIDRLLSVSYAGTIFALRLSIVCGLLTLLRLELAVTHKTWRE